MNTGPAAWDEVDFLSQWFAQLCGGGPSNQPQPGSDPQPHDHALTQEPGDDR